MRMELSCESFCALLTRNSRWLLFFSAFISSTRIHFSMQPDATKLSMPLPSWSGRRKRLGVFLATSLNRLTESCTWVRMACFPTPSKPSTERRASSAAIATQSLFLSALCRPSRIQPSVYFFLKKASLSHTNTVNKPSMAIFNKLPKEAALTQENGNRPGLFSCKRFDMAAVSTRAGKLAALMLLISLCTMERNAPISAEANIIPLQDDRMSEFITEEASG